MNKLKIISKIHNTSIIMYAIIILIAIICFCLIYNVKILNPLYIDWLLDGQDLSQHYLGWVAYRFGDWNFPIGLSNLLSYPEKTSVIFTDSIPLFAVIFKILSPILPDTFQYFGIWGLMCFILQGVITGKILYEATQNFVISIIGSLFGIFAPVMLFRMFSHTALAAHWLILLALLPLFLYRKYENTRKIYFLCFLIAVLASSVHIYFTLMCGLCIFAYSLLCILNNAYKKALIMIIIYAVVSYGTIWLLGGFYPQNITYTYSGLGFFSANFNTFFNPQNWSCILPNLPLYTGWQYEGFGYMGCGLIVLLVCLIILFISKNKALILNKNNNNLILAIFMLAFIATIIALSPIVTSNNVILYELNLSPPIMNLWRIFRSSGRLIWVDFYILLPVIMIAFSKLKKQKIVIGFMIFCAILQIYDIHNKLYEIHYKFLSIHEYKGLNEIPIFYRIGQNEKIKHVIVTFSPGESEFYTIGEWVLHNKKDLNAFAIVHPNFDTMFKNVDNELSNPTCDKIFIFDKDTEFDLSKYKLNYYYIDNYIIGYSDELDE